MAPVSLHSRVDQGCGHQLDCDRGSFSRVNQSDGWQTGTGCQWEGQVSFFYKSRVHAQVRLA